MISNTAAELNEAFKKAREIIEKHNNIIVTTHRNPDGDAIGSALGIFYYLKDKGKTVRLINNSPTPDNLKFIDADNDIEYYIAEKHDEAIKSAGLILVVDLNDIKRVNEMAEPIEESAAFKMVIDHHIDPKPFAGHYVVDTDSASAGQLIYKLVKEDFELDKKTATALYAAIMTDTGSFRFPRTDGEVHRIIGALIDAGADPVYIYENIYNMQKPEALKLLGRAFTSLEHYAGGKAAVMTLTRKDFKETGAAGDDVEGIVENSQSMSGVMLGVLISDNPDADEVRMSFRSKGDVSARDFALKFNGGGHQHAAGARVKHKDIKEVKEALIYEIKKVL
ncbi:MAG: DHH family phosphoesterase [Candidatus Kapaibacterium sp.]